MCVLRAKWVTLCSLAAAHLGNASMILLALRQPLVSTTTVLIHVENQACAEREHCASSKSTQQPVPVHPVPLATPSLTVYLLNVLVMVTALQINLALATNVLIHVQSLVCVAKMLTAPLVLTYTSASVRQVSLEIPAWVALLSLTVLLKLTVLQENSAMEASVSVSNRLWILLYDMY